MSSVYHTLCFALLSPADLSLYNQSIDRLYAHLH